MSVVEYFCLKRLKCYFETLKLKKERERKATFISLNDILKSKLSFGDQGSKCVRSGRLPSGGGIKKADQ